MSLYKFIFRINICVSILLASQVYSQQNDLINKAQELIYSNPDEAIKIAEHTLKIAQTSQEKAQSNFLLAKGFLLKGNFNQAITHAFSDDYLLNDITPKTRAEVILLRSKILRQLYFTKPSKSLLEESGGIIESLKEPSVKDSLMQIASLEDIYTLIETHKNQEAIASIDKAQVQFAEFLNKYPEKNLSYYLAKTQALSNLNEIDSAKVYLNQAFDILGAAKSNNLYDQSVIYRELGHLFLQKKLFPESEEALFISLKFAEILDNPTLLMEINKDLGLLYLASNKKSQHKVYNDKFLALNSTVEQKEQEAINTLYNNLSKQNELALAQEQEKHSEYRLILFIAASFILALGLVIWFRTVARKRRLKEIINYIEATKSNFLKSKPVKKGRKERVTIPEETERNLLSKLHKFESSKKFLNKDISLAVLAGQFETNTKYLSEIINKHYGDNFNTFINKLRINYIIEKLKTDPNYIHYKISFLAEECGFSSHSSFATVFKSIVGMSPNTFIKLIQEEREQTSLES